MIGYHTAENRGPILEEPLYCTKNDAWLGSGYYFWRDIEFAKYWGKDNYDEYDIYKAELNTDNCLDTVFNEKGYNFFCKIIEDTYKKLVEKNKRANLNSVITYIKKEIFNKINIEGVIYSDIPINKEKNNNRYSKIPPLYYKKRIQIVIYCKKNIINFNLLK